MNKTREKGINWHAGARKYQVQVMMRGRRHYLGLFSDMKSARAARDAKLIELHRAEAARLEARGGEGG